MAGIILDGEPLTQTTPLIVEDIPAGEHTVKILKEGFKTQYLQFVIAKGEVKTVHIELEEDYFNLLSPDKENVIVGGNQLFRGEDAVRLPSGIYSFKHSRETLRISPVYPGQKIIHGLNISIPFMVLIGGLLTAQDLLSPEKPDRLFSPATWTTYGVTLGMLGLDIALNIGKKKYLDSFTVYSLKSEKSRYMTGEYYERAEELLSRGRLAEALTAYTVLVDNHKDTIYFPRALYKISRIHTITGAFNLATSELMLIAKKYPLPELYDRTCKSLADLYFRVGNYRESITWLNKMVFIDPLYLKEDIVQFKASILETWFKEERNILPENRELLGELLKAFESTVVDFADREDIATYRYTAALYLYKAGETEEAKEQLSEAYKAVDGEMPELKRKIEELTGQIESGGETR